ncbi:MAG: hypothetical protein ACI4HQ_09920 [Acetatifactor sp.]
MGNWQYINNQNEFVSEARLPIETELDGINWIFQATIFKEFPLSVHYKGNIREK